MIDLREFLEELEDHKELLSVKDEMSANLDIPAVAAMSNRTGAQAIHFKKIAGYPSGFSIVSNLFSGQGHTFDYSRQMWGRIAIAIGVDPEVDYEQFIALLMDRYKNPILPMKLDTGVCKEEVYLGKDIDLFRYPFPLLHCGDGGRYGMGALICKDPLSDWQNMGIYRFMIVDHDKMVADFLTKPSLSNDTALIYSRYKNAQKPMPVAFVLGGAPALWVAAAMKLPPGFDEISYAGGLNLDPINLVKAETSDLLVPADAEMVIEGEVSFVDMVEEGPYGSIKGYSVPAPRPLINVKAITHRKNPIIPIVLDGTKVSDTQSLVSVTESMRMTMLCQEDQLPVRWFQIPADWNLTFGMVSVLNLMNGVVFRTARYIFLNTDLFDKLMVVEADLHPKSMTSVLNDLVHRCHPLKGDRLIKGFPQAVMPDYGEIEPGKGFPRVYYDLCWPAYWKPAERPTAITFETVFPKDIQERVLKRWKKDFKIPIEPVVLPELPGIGPQR